MQWYCVCTMCRENKDATLFVIFSFTDADQLVKCARILISMVIPRNFFCSSLSGLRDQRTLAVRVRSAAANVAATRSGSDFVSLVLLQGCNITWRRVNFSCGVCICLGVDKETDCQKAAHCHLLPPQGAYMFSVLNYICKPSFRSWGQA